jgi:O-Antigen ligase
MQHHQSSSGMTNLGEVSNLAEHRGRAAGAAFAIILSTSSILILCFGIAGVTGNSTLTGALTAGSVLSIGLVCFRRHIAPSKADFCFLLFVASICLSFLLNGQTSSVKECLLLVFSLAAYPACRLVTKTDVAGMTPSFVSLTCLIVALGAVTNAVALAQQWDDPHGKPLVFGFDAAPTNFLQSLCFVILAAVTVVNLTPRKTAAISVLIFLPVAIFAASMVRFTFVALAGSLFFAVLFSNPRQRKYVLVIAAVVLLAIVSGLAARYVTTQRFADYALEGLSGVITWQRPPSCDLVINLKNSIAIRKALTLDAFYLIPGAGLLGTGLDSFMSFSCIKLTEVHNSFLQAGVEFGWLGGTAFALLVIATFVSIIPLAKRGGAPLFIFCCLVFAILLSMAYGRISRDQILFAVLGAAGGLIETSRSKIPLRSASLAHAETQQQR